MVLACPSVVNHFRATTISLSIAGIAGTDFRVRPFSFFPVIGPVALSQSTTCTFAWAKWRAGRMPRGQGAYRLLTGSVTLQ